MPNVERITIAERAERIATYAYKAPDRAALVEYARLEIGHAIIEADVTCQGAVDLIERAVHPITEALNNPAHSWHGSDEARKWLIDAARVRGQ